MPANKASSLISNYSNHLTIHWHSLPSLIFLNFYIAYISEMQDSKSMSFRVVAKERKSPLNCSFVVMSPA